jgi:membrane-bound lytic murein transglycosylase D
MRSTDSAQFIREHNLKALPQFDIPMVINDRVVAWMEYFQGAGRNHFIRYLKRSGRYLPMMREILVEEGLPQDLVYISLIESGFNPHARSRANAVGPWQFIRATGRRYGTRVDGWVDERRDPRRATRAAARYFRDLYGEFGDWYLAMAAYNAGEGRVRKAIETTGSRNFWYIARHHRALRAETRDYVPKFIAAAIMAKMPDRFGFADVVYDRPVEFETAKVETQTDLAVIAKCAGVDRDAVFDLNPHLIRGTTPPGLRHYEIRLPNGTAQSFGVAYADLPKSKRVQVVHHRVRHGDTLWGIARRYGVSVDRIAKANDITSHRRLRRGKTLVIPISGAYVRYARAEKGRGSGSSSKGHIRHRVKEGETAGHIAERYGVTVAQIRRWNGLNRRSFIREGQTLKIHKRGTSSGGGAGGLEVTHVVESGETLGGIARRHGVSTKQLMALNDIKDPRRVRAGQRLIIRRQAPKSSSTTAIRLAELDTSEDSSSKASGVSGSAVRHKVRPGESLWEIARRYGVSTKELMALNDIKDPRRVRDGRKLKIPRKDEEAPPTTAVRLSDLGQPLDTLSEGNESPGPVVTHRVKPGESIWVIARRYGVSTKELMAANGISDPKKVRDGRQLTIPGKRAKSTSSAAIRTTEPKRSSTGSSKSGVSSGSAVRHKVKPGENLWVIAQRYGVSTKEIMALNGIEDPRRVRDGTTLVIRGRSKPASTGSSGKGIDQKDIEKPTQAAANRSVTYQVKSGDTLWDIARRHQVTIAQLQQWNNLGDPSRVRPGTKLTIHKD